MDARAAEFRESVRQENSGKASGRRRFTEAQRLEALRYLERRHRQGVTVAVIAEDLPDRTSARYRDDAECGGRPGTEPTPTSAPVSAGPISLVSLKEPVRLSMDQVPGPRRRPNPHRPT